MPVKILLAVVLFVLGVLVGVSFYQDISRTMAHLFGRDWNGLYFLILLVVLLCALFGQSMDKARRKQG